jgi:cell division protein FtsA
MDSRVGYPNEHLSSNTNINVTSPLFATGVGLVAKGFEQFELLKSRNEKISTRMHSQKNKGSFFEKLKTFFDEKVD